MAEKKRVNLLDEEILDKLIANSAKHLLNPEKIKEFLNGFILINNGATNIEDQMLLSKSTKDHNSWGIYNNVTDISMDEEDEVQDFIEPESGLHGQGHYLLTFTSDSDQGLYYAVLYEADCEHELAKFYNIQIIKHFDSQT